MEKIDIANCDILQKKVEVAHHAIGFAERTPLYEGNLCDEKISNHLREALEHLDCVRALIQSKIYKPKVNCVSQQPKDT